MVAQAVPTMPTVVFSRSWKGPSFKAAGSVPGAADADPALDQETYNKAVISKKNPIVVIKASHAVVTFWDTICSSLDFSFGLLAPVKRRAGGGWQRGARCSYARPIESGWRARRRPAAFPE